MKEYVCAHCEVRFCREPAQAAKSRRNFCSRKCSGLARRTGLTKAQKRAAKAEYDRAYREKNLESIKAKKRAHRKRSYDPIRAKAQRAVRLHRHREYIQAYNARPENKAKKRAYDLALRRKEYADFADAWRLYLELKQEIIRRMPDAYERLKARGYYERKAACLT